MYVLVLGTTKLVFVVPVLKSTRITTKSLQREKEKEIHFDYLKSHFGNQKHIDKRGIEP